MATPDEGLGRMPSRNEPCPCGSGKKFKKCCITEWEKYNDAKKALNNDSPPPTPRKRYRFSVGDNVLAYHDKGYQAGRIVKLNYWEPGWTDPVPYQILLVDGKYCGRLIYAPADEDQMVKALPEDFGKLGSNIYVKTDRGGTVGKRRLRARGS